MTGASGAILGIRLLEALGQCGVVRHLILSDWARRTIELETDYTPQQVLAMGDVVYPADDLAASVSSGSLQTNGMVIMPCSMKTLSAIANGFSYNLIARAADVTLMERRPLVVVPRETPLSSIHLRNMLTLSEVGAILVPPCVGFYTRPRSLEDVVDHLVGKVLDELPIPHELYRRWESPSCN